MSKNSVPVEKVVPIFDLEQLPEGWGMPTIGDICSKIHKVNPKDEPDSEFSYIDISGIDNQHFRIANTKRYSGADAPSRARQLVNKGDVVFSTVRTYLKNFARVSSELDYQIASTGFCVLRAASTELSKYLFYFVQYEKFLYELAKFQRGTSYPAVRDRDVFAQYIPVPPKGHAGRIVAEIEKQFSRLDEAVANLKRVKANLKRYKAAVLKAAVEGKLTEEWRKQHPDVEPADKLLERILAERREKWKGRGKYKEPAAPDTTDLPELPDGWVWVRLDTIAAIKGGITVDKKRKDPTARLVPYLRVANVQRGYLELRDMKEIEAPSSSIEDLRLLPGDILFNEGGDRDKLGRGWVWEGQVEECIHQNHVFRARLYLHEMNSKLISWWGNSFGKYYFLRVGKQTTNLASINITKLSEFPVPLPPIEEQLQI